MIHSYHKSDSSSLPPDSFLTAESYLDLRPGDLNDIITLASGYTPSISSLNITFTDSSDTTISLSSKMLSFSDTSDFYDALAIADYIGIDTIALISNSFAGFNSSFLDFIGDSVVGTTISADVIEDILRATDRKLLNTDNAVKIEDYVYIDFPNKNEGYRYHLTGSNHSLIDYKRSSTTSCPNVDRITYSGGWYRSDGKKSSPFDRYYLSAYKSSLVGLFVTKVEMGFMLFEYFSGNNEYEIRSTSVFGLWHDHWPDDVSFKKPSQSNYTVIDQRHVYEDDIRTINPRIIFYRRYGPALRICVQEFGRTHNWIWNFYEDVHNDVVW